MEKENGNTGKILLPSLGEIEVKNVVLKDIIAYKKNCRTNSFEAAKKLFCSVFQKDLFSSLEQEDIIEVGKYVAKEFDNLDGYLSCIDRGLPFDESLKIALDNSPVNKSIDNLSKSMVLSFNAYNRMLGNFSDNYSIVNSIKPLFDTTKYITKSIDQMLPKMFDFQSDATRSIQKIVMPDTSFINAFSNLKISNSINRVLYDNSLLWNSVTKSIDSTFSIINNITREAFAISDEKTLLQFNRIIAKSEIAINKTNLAFRKEAGKNKDVFLEEKDGDERNAFEIDGIISVTHDRASNLIVSSNGLVETIVERLDKRIDDRLSPYKSIFDRFCLLSSTSNFSEILDEFKESINRTHWKIFWDKIGENFKPKPEEIAQANLSLFLEGKVSGAAFVGREINAGDGFIDVLVNFLGLNYIVELKIIGCNRAISWAESGIDQLNTYMNDFKVSEAFLLVFDGRKTELGRNMNEFYDVTAGRIIVKHIKIFH